MSKVLVILVGSEHLIKSIRRRDFAVLHLTERHPILEDELASRVNSFSHSTVAKDVRVSVHVVSVHIKEALDAAVRDAQPRPPAATDTENDDGYGNLPAEPQQRVVDHDGRTAFRIGLR
jgi:hypothetical protein